MDEIQENLEPQGTSRRTVMKGAAWAAPVVAVAAAVPMAAASPEPVEATAIGATTTSPFVNAVGLIRPFGIDDGGADAFLPDGQTFTLESSDLDFNTIVTSVTGGTLSQVGPGEWLITPTPGTLEVRINFNSPTTGSYVLTNNGPAEGGPTWNGQVRPRV
jgi:hypothetical protein